MADNLVEWCSDYYEAGYYYESPELDPQGPAFATRRSMRGSPFINTVNPVGWWRVTLRWGVPPVESAHTLGVRCAQTSP